MKFEFLEEYDCRHDDCLNTMSAITDVFEMYAMRKSLPLYQTSVQGISTDRDSIFKIIESSGLTLLFENLDINCASDRDWETTYA